MMKSWFLIVVSLLFFSNASLSWGQIITGDDIDPNILWKTDDSLGGFTGFQIHPSGNIIANKGCEFFEIDGKTAKLIRAYPVIYGYSGVEDATTVSKDGKYFSACFAGTGTFGTTTDIYIFDYATGNVVKKLKDYGEALCFLNDSKRLVIRAYKGSLTIYDIEKDTSYFNDAKMFVQVISVSNNGKFIATAGVSLKFDGKQYSEIKLWDATTLKLIHEFKMQEGTEETRFIQFSPDSKYIGCQVYWSDLYIQNS
jgi:WD40 repeat protein